MHGDYTHFCLTCGKIFLANRLKTRDLSNTIALIVNGSVDTTTFCASTLLHNNASVIICGKEGVYTNLSKFEHFESWKPKIFFIATENINVINSHKIFTILQKLGHLDFLIVGDEVLQMEKKSLNIETMDQHDLENIIFDFSVTPALFVQNIIPFLKKSLITPFLIFQNGERGICDSKSAHTNIIKDMASASLSMMVNGISKQQLTTETGKKFATQIISIGNNIIQHNVPSYDSIDIAYMILHPILCDLKSRLKTVSFYNTFSY
ncbi:hypothetical protein EIN_194640 [Entamoeba invadens IP1]|uniref:Uncharacterized protein n=1 Tax=Entamoeba invadens IP1 TaxID=370355 RepID=A0A0A1U701_ENTIV|nr:hypothetical protein EIN_194640 [Entamoeba invadens IP1]ELP88705.1 hypothetical protein EIN_194640 [Entamoeba invadens IP1]|eukprot:XP_004255476.1 hypothetical protein EIN_194640 [Entamoeba invadens IP1]